MIISKPKTTALFALGVFIIICFGIGSYTLRAILNNVGSWYHYLLSGLFLSIAFVLLLRQVLSYKLIKVGDNMIRVEYPFKRVFKVFKLSDIINWKEVVIKTKNAPFKQLEISFDTYLLKLSVQENTNYEQLLTYLKKKAAKKQL